MVLRKNKKRVIVAMSGGVDSSVAAALLVKKGYEVIGISMKLWKSDFCGRQKQKSCCSTQDLADARFVAGQLGIPFYALDLSVEFKKEVMDYFSAEYTKARTPNPCIICNNKIKFGALIKKASQLDADLLATGHYAKIKYNKKSKRFALSVAKDKTKDQSYVLFGLTQNQLKRVIFPLGGYSKLQIRQMSKKMGLKTSEKKESQEICFVWDNDYREFLKSNYNIKPKTGMILDERGNILGKHCGFMFYTIGQRRGLGLGGNKKPMYVLKIDPIKNVLIAGPKESLEKNILFVNNINWVSIEKTTRPIKVKAKIRYNHKAADAVVYPNGKVVFAKPQSAITPGQAVVFYKGDEVLGGGWIR